MPRDGERYARKLFIHFKPQNDSNNVCQSAANISFFPVLKYFGPE